MYRIKCSNGKYVNKTYEGTYISFTKAGKMYSTENIARKNLKFCEMYASKYGNGQLTFELEKLIVSGIESLRSDNLLNK